MTRRIVVKEAAQSDLRDLAGYIAESSLKSAMRFLDSADRSFQLLADAPDRGSLCGFRRSLSSDVRMWPVRDFRHHLIFYRATEERVEILRVLHGARDSAAVFDG